MLPDFLQLSRKFHKWYLGVPGALENPLQVSQQEVMQICQLTVLPNILMMKLNIVGIPVKWFLFNSQDGNQPGKHGKVSEFESGQEKVKEYVFLPLVCYRE